MLMENRGFWVFDYKGKGRVAVIILQWRGEGLYQGSYGNEVIL